MKIYLVKITGCHTHTRWYSGKIGKEFDCTLHCLNYDSARRSKGNVVGFMVVDSYIHFIHPEDCKVIYERIEYPYIKKDL